MDMYVYINVDRDAGIENSYCNYRHVNRDIAYTSAHTCKTFKK